VYDGEGRLVETPFVPAAGAGRLTETQAVVDPALLEKVFGELAAELCPPPARGAKRAAASPAQRWLIVDSTLWELLPRRHWALWRQQGRSQSAARLHVGLHLLGDHRQAGLFPGETCGAVADRRWSGDDARGGGDAAVALGVSALAGDREVGIRHIQRGNQAVDVAPDSPSVCGYGGRVDQHAR